MIGDSRLKWINFNLTLIHFAIFYKLYATSSRTSRDSFQSTSPEFKNDRDSETIFPIWTGSAVCWRESNADWHAKWYNDLHAPNVHVFWKENNIDSNFKCVCVCNFRWFLKVQYIKHDHQQLLHQMTHLLAWPYHPRWASSTFSGMRSISRFYTTSMLEISTCQCQKPITPQWHLGEAPFHSFLIFYVSHRSLNSFLSSLTCRAWWDNKL